MVKHLSGNMISQGE
ncbi:MULTISPECIES: hypothetical protein [Peribacillus]